MTVSSHNHFRKEHVHQSQVRMNKSFILIRKKEK